MVTLTVLHETISWAQSQGKFDVTFDVVGPVKLSKGYAKYGYNNNGRDAAPEEMVTEALKR